MIHNAPVSALRLAALFTVAAGVSSTAPAHAGGGNEIRAVTVEDRGELTQIRVRGTVTPTFSTYRLERPTRVVVDVARAGLAEAVTGAHETSATIAANTWAVSQVAAQELTDGGAVVRIVVTLARPGRYDVKADGSDLVIAVTARDPAPVAATASDVASARAEAEAARRTAAIADKARVEAERGAAGARDRAQAEVTAAQSEARRAKNAATAAQAEAERLRALAASEARRAADAVAAAARGNQPQAERDRLAKQVDAARADAEKSRRAAAAAQAEAERARRESSAAQAELERARTQAATAQTELARTRADATAARAETDRIKKVAAGTQVELDRAKDKASAAEAEAAKARAQLAAIQSEAATARRQMVTVQADAANTRRAAAAVQAEIDRARAKASAAEAEAATARARLAALETDSARARQAAADDQARARDAKQAAATELARARALAQAAQADVAVLRVEAATAQADVAKLRAQAETAQGDATAARGDAVAARAEAEAARKQAELDRKVADADKRRAEAARAEADRLATAARKRLVELDRDAAVAKQTQGRAAEAERLAVAREGAARAAQQAAQRERTAAVAAAARAVAERDRSATTPRADHGKLGAAARAAEARLRAAEAATAKTEAQRASAEAAAQTARAQAATARATVTSAGAARRQAEAAAADAAKRTQLAERDRAAAEQRKVAAERDRAAAEQRKVAAERDAALARGDAAKAAARRVHEEAALARARTRATKVVPPPAPARTVAIKDVTYDDGDVVIAVGGAVHAELEMADDHMAILVIDGAELPTKLERKLDVSKFNSAVKAISSYRDRRNPGRVRVVVDLASPARPTLVRDGNLLRVGFGGAVARRPMQSLPPPVVGGYGASSAPIAPKAVAQLTPGRRRKVYRGPTVNLDFKDAPIRDLLRLLADVGRINLVVPDNVDARVTVRMKNVPWDQALEVILQSKGMWYRQEGNLYRVDSRKILDDEDEKEAARRAAALASEAPEPQVERLNYAEAGSLRSKLEPLLSPKGKIEVDERTNSLIINDLASHRRRIAALALSLDTQTPQISIEARIVEARSTFAREFGIQWGGRASATAAGGNSTGLIFPSNVSLEGGADDNNTPTSGVATPSDFAVNLPAAVGTGSGGALGLSLGSIGGNFNINLRLSALEDSGTVRIVSAPKVTALNGTQALISQGVSIPVSVVSAAGTQTTFVPADLSLEVTPYVSQRDCAIAMNLHVSKNEPDFVNTGARGDPTILRKEATTKILVRDGETAVMGGVYTRNTGLSYNKVPLLGDLPVFGWLFKSRKENDDRTELLIFITPKITNKAFLPCQ